MFGSQFEGRQVKAFSARDSVEQYLQKGLPVVWAMLSYLLRLLLEEYSLRFCFDVKGLFRWQLSVSAVAFLKLLYMC